MRLMGDFLPAGDERMRATVQAIAGPLTEDDLVLRYRVGVPTPASPARREPSPSASSELVSALAMIGETERAHVLC